MSLSKSLNGGLQSSTWFRKSSIHLPLPWPGSCLKCTDIYSNIVFTILRNLPPPTHPPHSVWCSGCLKWANFNLNTVFTIKHINIMFTILRNHPSPTSPHSVWPSGCWSISTPNPFLLKHFLYYFEKSSSTHPPNSVWSAWCLRQANMALCSLLSHKISKYKQRILHTR